MKKQHNPNILESKFNADYETTAISGQIVFLGEYLYWLLYNPIFCNMGVGNLKPIYWAWWSLTPIQSIRIEPGFLVGAHMKEWDSLFGDDIKSKTWITTTSQIVWKRYSDATDVYLCTNSIQNAICNTWNITLDDKKKHFFQCHFQLLPNLISDRFAKHDGFFGFLNFVKIFHNYMLQLGKKILSRHISAAMFSTIDFHLK